MIFVSREIGLKDFINRHDSIIISISRKAVRFVLTQQLGNSLENVRLISRKKLSERKTLLFSTVLFFGDIQQVAD